MLDVTISLTPKQYEALLLRLQACEAPPEEEGKEDWTLSFSFKAATVTVHEATEVAVGA
jgi:hypothetical protein